MRPPPAGLCGIYALCTTSLRQALYNNVYGQIFARGIRAAEAQLPRRLPGAEHARLVVADCDASAAPA